MIFQKFIYKFFSADAHRQIFHDILTDMHDILTNAHDFFFGAHDVSCVLHDKNANGQGV